MDEIPDVCNYNKIERDVSSSCIENTQVATYSMGGIESESSALPTSGTVIDCKPDRNDRVKKMATQRLPDNRPLFMEKAKRQLSENKNQ